MISVSEAEALISQYLASFPEERVPLANATGRVLREPLTADRDFPPFNRVAMDGIAVDSNTALRAFPIAFTQAAGAPARALTNPGQCAEVMTGAVLPAGTDCVIPVERISVSDGVASLADDVTLQSMDNVHQQGSDRAQGATLLPPGGVLSAPQLAVAATIGATELCVAAQPRIAIISTGNELVPVEEVPLPHQIRRSNVHAIDAGLRRAGFTDTHLEHISDSLEEVRQGLARVFEQADVVILSGGVSAGRFDFIPDALASLDVVTHFHKIRQRPGKPMLFGTTPDAKAVFGLPGNPVSALVCLERYILPALLAAQGLSQRPATERPCGRLTDPVRFKKALTCFTPVRFSSDNGDLHATPVPMNGSGDLAGLAESDGFLELPETQTEFAAGDAFTAWRWT